MTTAALACIFDDYAVSYDAWYERFNAAFVSELRVLAEAMPHRGAMLEVGVGTGRFAAALGVEFGVEISAVMAKIAMGRGVKVVLAQGESLPFRTGSFQAVLFVTSLCFMQDPKNALREATRVVAAGGGIIVGFVDASSLLGRSYGERTRHPLFSIARLFRPREVIDLLKGAGLEILGVWQTLRRAPEALREPETPERGYGRGSFVVVSAAKTA